MPTHFWRVRQASNKLDTLRQSSLISSEETWTGWWRFMLVDLAVEIKVKKSSVYNVLDGTTFHVNLSLHLTNLHYFIHKSKNILVHQRHILNFTLNISSTKQLFPSSAATYVAIYWINCAKRPSRLIIKHATTWNSLCVLEKLERDFKASDDVWSGLKVIRSGGCGWMVAGREIEQAQRNAEMW